MSLETLYLKSAPIFVEPGYKEDISSQDKEKYQSEAKLHIKEIFEKEEAPDYHALLQINQSGLTKIPSEIMNTLQLCLTLRIFSDNEAISLERKEEEELLKLKKWIFKEQIKQLEKKSNDNT